MLSAFFTCYLWWLLAGFLLGWLCNWWLCKCCGNNKTRTTTYTNTTHANANATHTNANASGTTAKAAAFAAAPVATAAAVATSVAAPTIDTAAAKALGFNVKGVDDLQVIEGIGPKICGLFHAAGYKTFTQVSQMSIQQMSKILDDAGPRFKLANPETWAQQAGLAANNRWAELKALQDNLTAGVTTQQDRSEL